MARTPPPRPPRKAPPTRTRPTRADAQTQKIRTQRAKTGEKQPISRRRKWALIVGSGFILMFAALVGVAYSVTRIPLPQQVGLAQSTILTYSDGTEMARIGTVNRTDVSLNDVPLNVRNAVLAAEDRRYYKEPGISLRGIARAVVANVSGGGIKEGGSTITQQYVKNAYLTQERTFSRKFKEIVIAVKLDRKYSKDEVLEWYLNTIYFGRGAYGIEAATMAYFGGHAKDLSVEQGAVLAGLIRCPGCLDPRRNEDAARTRWGQVLDAMAEEKWISPEQRAKAKYPFVRELGSGVGGGAGLRSDIAYLRQAVENELIAKGIKEDRITSGALRITTTIDRKSQTAAQQAVESITKGTPDDLQEALVAVDPKTGAIRASYGGKQFNSKNYLDNVFDSKRQAGSSFKPITLAAALDDGISLKTKYDGKSPQSIPGTTYTGKNALKNFSNEQFGKVDLIVALAHSVNTIFVPLGIDAGLDHVVDVAHALGIPSEGKGAVDLKPLASLSLGVDDVTPLDMGSVYASLAAGGKHNDPFLVSKVTDRHNNTIYQHEENETEALPANVVADTTFAMQEVIKQGTGGAAALNGRPAAGKTGTTSDNTSAWFCGFTPQLATAVSLFYDDNRPLRNIGGFAEVTGGTLPAKIWKAFMDAALQGQPVEQFAKPGNVGQPLKPSASPTPSPTPTTAVRETPSPEPTLQLPDPQSPSPTPTPTPTPTPSTSPNTNLVEQRSRNLER